MQTPRSIFALLVGINEYAGSVPHLRGCVGDVHRVQEYLEAHFNNGEFTFQPKILTDREATRTQIIAGFDHFRQARDGDICLFHYSGHGSQCPAPREFWDIEPDKKHETLVCYDSRTEGGRDLLDKELSFLIWQATQGKDVHFIVVMDCCHSGTITRSPYIQPRLTQERQDGLDIRDYLGYEHYQKIGEHAYTPPQGRHLLLAAARSRETAKEVYAGATPCGIFTYCLLEALRNARNQLSYAELLNRVSLRVRSKVSEQSPQLEAVDQHDRSRFFLTGNPASEGPAYLVAYDKDKKNWILNAGAMHGIAPGDETARTIVELADMGERVALEDVSAHYAVVSGMGGYPKDKSYKARIAEMASARLFLAYAQHNDPAGEQFIRQTLTGKPGLSYHIVDRPEDADYLIHARYGYLFLTKPDEMPPAQISGENPLHKIRSVFKKIQGYSEAAAVTFLNCLETVSQWTRLSQLSNPATTIRPDEIQIQLFRTLHPGDYENDAAVEEIDWAAPGAFDYQPDGDEWCMPAFQLKVKNTGSRPLWVSLVYFASDFSIANSLMPLEELPPEAEAWAFDRPPGDPNRYKTIPIKIQDDLHAWEITEIDECLKVLVCTEEFSTDDFNQKGLEMDQISLEVKRTFGRSGGVRKPDWVAKDIPVHIRRPLEARKIKSL